MRYQIIAAEAAAPLARRLVGAYPDRFTYHDTSWGKFPDGTDNIVMEGFSPFNMISGEVSEMRSEQRGGTSGRDVVSYGTGQPSALSLVFPSRLPSPPSFPTLCVPPQHVLFLASFHNNDVTLSQFQVMIVLLQSFIESLTVVLPYSPVGTMERVMKEGTVATASTYAHLFSSLPNCGKPTRLMVYDLHTLQNRFYLHGNAVASLQTTIPLLKERLKDGDIDCVAFPDDGAAKRWGGAEIGRGGGGGGQAQEHTLTPSSSSPSLFSPGSGSSLMT